MSGVRATSSDTASDDAAAPRSWGSPGVRAAIIGTSLIGFALRLWILFVPGLMSVTQYDDGAYFGSAVRLIHGVLPYRDYAFVQPPGITVLMVPAALESNLSGTAWALVIARFLCVLAGTAAVVLAGFLVRHRGTLAVLLTSGIMAIYPVAATSSRTVLLEPWLVLFCLIGAVTVFDGDQPTSRARRLLWGGVAFGFGGAIKVWAIVPVLVIIVLCLPHVRRTAVFAGGAAAGFLIPVLPFFIASPGHFYNDVVVAQLGRVGIRTATWRRFPSMLGISKTLTPTTVVVLAITVLVFVIAAQVAAWLLTRRPPAPLDWFALASAALIVLMFLWPPYYAAHYAAFFGPFLALSVALPVARLAEGLAARRTATDRPGTHEGTPRLARAGLIVLALAVLAGAAAQVSPPTVWTGRFGTPTVTLRQIPRGACVLSDSAVYLLIANRFSSRVADCSKMVDSLGTDLALGDGRRPESGAGQVPAVTQAWHQAFSTASWVLLTPKNAIRIPWNPALRAYFQAHFRLVREARTFDLYARHGTRAA